MKQSPVAKQPVKTIVIGIDRGDMRGYCGTFHPVARSAGIQNATPDKRQNGLTTFGIKAFSIGIGGTALRLEVVLICNGSVFRKFKG